MNTGEVAGGWTLRASALRQRVRTQHLRARAWSARAKPGSTFRSRASNRASIAANRSRTAFWKTLAVGHFTPIISQRSSRVRCIPRRNRSCPKASSRPGDHRVAGVVPSRRGLDAGTRSLGESQQLWRYYPQFLDAVDDDVAAPWVLDLWRRLPTPRAARRVREVTLTRVLKQHRIRRISASTLRDRLRAPAVKLAPGAAEAAVAHVRLVAERLALVNRQLDHAHRELGRLVDQLTGAAPADDPSASTEDEPSSPEPRDAAILLSLPGIGTEVLAALLAEGGDAVRRRDFGALRCLCGVAPVDKSGGWLLRWSPRRLWRLPIRPTKTARFSLNT